MTTTLEANEPTTAASASVGGNPEPAITAIPAPAQVNEGPSAIEAPPGPIADPIPVVKDHGLWCDIKEGRTAKLPYWLAIVCLIINVLLSGVGTLISAIHPDAAGMRVKIVIIGLLQLIFLWLFIPWIWSIVYGALLLKHAEREGPDTN